MKFSEIFTQYNDTIEKSIDVDPLGFGAIWTYFGQEIFQNKISSATFDIRNFNLNLLNHYIIKNLSINNEQIKDRILINPKETIEKLLLILENMIVYSWYKNQVKWGKSRKGLLGTSKAITKWTNSSNIEKSFNINSNFKNLELLKNQKTTGVNGIYKGSFLAMFNDANKDRNLSKDYDKYFEDIELYEEITELIDKNKYLKALSTDVIELFNQEEIEVANIPILRYANVFLDHIEISNYMKNFWLKYLGFESQEAKLIYDKIDFETSVEDIIKQVNSDYKSEKLENIISLEPKLNYYENLFYYLLQQDGLLVDDFEKKDAVRFDISFSDELEDIVESSVVKERLKELTNITNLNQFIQYHQNRIIERGDNRTPWVEIKDNKIKVTNINANSENIEEESLLEIYKDKIWGDRFYYLYTVSSIKRGFER